MSISNKTILTNPIHFIAFGFGAGLSPVAPGTMGSLAAIPLILLMSLLTWPWYILITLLVIMGGTYAADWSSRQLKMDDPSGIVIDEIAGMMVTLMFVPVSFMTVIFGFALFRFFDILKPWPIGWMDRHLKGGIGIMMDDLMAGLFAGFIVLILWLYI